MRLIILILILGGCQSPNTRTVNSTPENASKPSVAKNVQYHFGIRVLVAGPRSEQSLKVAKIVQDQLALFEPCLVFRQSDPIRIEAKWWLGSDSLINKVRVTKAEPANEEFKACFLKQVKLLDFPPFASGLNGILAVGTFEDGTKTGPLRFEK